MNAPPIHSKIPPLLGTGAVLIGLYLTTFYSYLLFHTLVEIFSVAVACGIFMVAWNSRRFLDNNYLLFIGIAYLFIGGLDLLHALTYKNMGVFPGEGANLPTQLWIAARYLQGISLLAAPFFLGRRLKVSAVITGYLATVSLLLLSIFAWRTFPPCFVEGVGLTPFKKLSEYIIAALLVTALLSMLRRRQGLHRDVVRLLAASIVLLVLAELTFTIYNDVYGVANMVGHFAKFIAFYLIYKAMIETGLARPYDLLFRELKQRGEALRESRELLRAVIEGTSDAVYVKDLSGRYLLFNTAASRIMGKHADEVIGHDDTVLFSPSEARTVMEGDREVMSAGETITYEETITTAAGNRQTFLSTKGPLVDDRGNMCGLFGIARNITERKRMAEEIEILNTHLAAKAEELEEANMELEAANQDMEIANRELEETNQELESFSHTVSHDLRAPLTNINGSCQILNDLCGDRVDEQGKRFLRYMREEIQRMDMLIGALLKFSRLNRQELHKEEVDLSEMASAITTGLKMREPTRQVDVTIAEGMTCCGDPLLLYAVMENLLGNAWKYTGKKESAGIEVGVTESEGGTVYFVRDNGAGFDMGEAHRLFGTFQRLHDRSEFEGTGIGLATVRRIIQRHGGRVWAEGEPGKGATFFFSLP